MKSPLRMIFGLLVMLATLLLSNCSPYGCRVTFGSSTCSAPGSGGGGPFGGGGGGGSAAAYAYAIDQNGTIDGYSLSNSGFAAISGYTAPAVPVNSGGVGMVVAQKQFLYAGFGNTGQLFGWVIGSNGVLTAISGSPFSSSFLAGFINGVGQDNIITNPAGTLLFISDAIAESVYVFQIGSGGVLAPVTGSPFSLPVGFTPMNLATDGLGKYLYVVNGNYVAHQGSQVAAFSIGTGSSLGQLTVVPGSPFAFKMWQLRGDPTGQYLIGTSGSSAFYSGVSDDTHLYTFTITQSGASAGAITAVTGSPVSTTYSPFSIAAQSNTGGTLVYSLSFNDAGSAFNPLEGDSISSSGVLSPLTNSPFSGVGNGSWAQFDQSGTILVVYASYLNSSTNTTTTQLTPLAVGSSGALTQPAGTLTLVTPGFWVVTDPN